MDVIMYGCKLKEKGFNKIKNDYLYDKEENTNIRITQEISINMNQHVPQVSSLSCSEYNSTIIDTVRVKV